MFHFSNPPTRQTLARTPRETNNGHFVWIKQSWRRVYHRTRQRYEMVIRRDSVRRYPVRPELDMSSAPPNFGNCHKAEYCNDCYHQSRQLCSRCYSLLKHCLREHLSIPGLRRVAYPTKVARHLFANGQPRYTSTGNFFFSYYFISPILPIAPPQSIAGGVKIERLPRVRPLQCYSSQYVPGATSIAPAN